ncbi:MAG: molybdopterin-dependent oxidoreductase [candidate division WOR-3 bacterium]
MSSVKEYRTKCSFCSMQDDLTLKREDSNSAVFGRDSLFRLYYDKRNGRGLCARGNFTIEILNTPYRLREAELFGKTTSIEEAIEDSIKEFKRMREKKNNIAILISGNHTLEEAFLAKRLSELLNTDLLGLFPFEDEALLCIKNNLSFNELAEADLILVVGDVFSNSPTLAKLILNARNKKRGNRLISLDIMKNKVSLFAEHLEVKPEYLSYFLTCFLDYLKGKSEFKLEENIGISSGKAEMLEKALKNAKNGYILFSNIYGHFLRPYSIVRKLSEIANITNAKFAVIPVGQNSLGVGRVIGNFNNANVIKALKEKKLEGLIVLGGNPFEFIPDFEKIFGYLNFVLSTCYFKGKNSSECIIPTVFSFEKEGSIISLEEKVVNLGNPIPKPGACISSGDFVSKFLFKITGEKTKAEVKSLKPLPFREEKRERKLSSILTKEFPFYLIGIGLPYHYDGGEVTRRMKWNEGEIPYVFINSKESKKIKEEKIKVETPNGSSFFKVADCKLLGFEVEENMILAPVHFPEVRKLFSLEVDEDGLISVGVEKARIKIDE